MKLKNNLCVLILVGIPASGKTQRAEQILLKNPNYYRISRDGLRDMLRNETQLDPGGEGCITDMHENIIRMTLSRGKDVLIDDTNCNEERLRHLINIVTDYTNNVTFEIVDCPLEVALQRDAKRKNPVGELIIRKCYDNYKYLLDSFEFDKPMKYVDYKFEYNRENTKKLPEAYVVDLDGTLCIPSHKRESTEWDKVGLDKLNIEVFNMINTSTNQDYYPNTLVPKLIFVSGRSEACREITEQWLWDKCLLHTSEYLLFMREKDDYRKDEIIKREIYLRNIEPNYFVRAAFDDRLSIVKMWNELGIFCFNVNQGNKIF